MQRHTSKAKQLQQNICYFLIFELPKALESAACAAYFAACTLRELHSKFILAFLMKIL